MNEWIAKLEQAFTDYRQELEECEKKAKPTDGLLGFGKSVKDDACHDRFDARISEITDAIAAGRPSAEDAEQALRLLLMRSCEEGWHLSAQWMLRAAERHCLSLIPFLKPESAKAICREYGECYKRWDRLPAQKEVYKALKAQGKES